MRFRKWLTTSLIGCAWLLAASGCARPERVKPIFPRSADLQAVTAAKPVPSADIVISAQAAAAFDVAIERWGDGVSAAGARICRWAVRNGAALPFPCPPARADETAGD